MKAMILSAPGSVEELKETELPIPELKEDEVLIEVHAISINPVDVKSRKGKGVYGRIKDISPIVLGWDVSGVVSASNSALFKKGDEVFGMVNFPGHGKAYAEYVAAPASQLALKPASISFEEAAAATLAALTAYQALVKNANVQKGQRVLIHAAAGGVGHFAVQMAKHLGAYVIGTASEKNRDFVLSLGADEHIDYHGDALDQLRDIDFSLDTLGGDNIDRTIPLIKKGGTLISIPTGFNDTVTEKAKEAGVNGYFFLVSSNGDDMAVLAEWLASGVLKAHVSQTYSFDELGQAHEQVESGRTVGKVVVKIK